MDGPCWAWRHLPASTGSAGVGRAGEASSWFMALSPCQGRLLALLLFKASQPPLPSSAAMGKREARGLLFSPREWLLSLSPPRPQWRAAAPLSHHSLAGRVAVDTQLHLLQESLSVPVPTHSNTLPSDVPMCGPSGSVCVLSWGPFEF